MIFHVFANRSNVGDWLSALGIQKLLGKHPYTELLCDEPFVPDAIAALSKAGPDDFVIIGGGGLFMNYFTPFWREFEPLSTRLRYALWGVGYCDLKLEPSLAPRELLAPIVARSRLCSLRDELSRQLLGMDNLADPVPCPSLNMVEPEPPGLGLLHVDNYDSIRAAVYETMDAVGRNVAQRTGRPFYKTNNRIQTGRTAELSRCLEFYKKSDFVLSSALHGCIIAAAMGRKILAVSGDRKIEGFMNAIGLGDWVLDAPTENDVDRALSTLDKQPSAAARVRAAREANQSIANLILAELR